MDIIGISYMLITFGSYQVNHSATLPHNVINFLQSEIIYCNTLINLKHFSKHLIAFCFVLFEN